MKRSLFLARSLALSLILLLGGSVAAKENYYENNNDMCDYDENCCTDTPLCCGRWNLKFKAGIAPSSFTNREETYAVGCEQDNCDQNNGRALVNLGQLPKFTNFFKNPGVLVGGEVGWAASDHTELFGEVVWRANQGRRRKADDQDLVLTRSAAPFTTLSFGDLENATDGDRIDSNSAIAGYVGWRYYFGRFWCCRFAPFVGAKVGVLGRRRVNAGLALKNCGAAATCDDIAGNPTVLAKGDEDANAIFKRTTVVSGGPQVGFTFCLWKTLSFHWAVEFVASGQFRNNQNVELSTVDADNASGFTNLIIGKTGTEMTYPVTFGLMYEF